MNNVILHDVWNFFCQRIPRNPEDVEVENERWSETEWIFQTEQMRPKLVRSTISSCSSSEIHIKIPLMTRIFELTIRKSTDFPESSPSLSGDFADGFQDFEWDSEHSNLLELTEKYTDYCQSLDEAIQEIKNAENDGFLMEDLEIDEDECGHLMVRLHAKKYDETLELSIDFLDFQSFPRVLKCVTNPGRTASFDCEKWNNEERLGANLKKLYGEEKSDEFEDVVQHDSESVEIMDFI
uniref:Uncharacterized protein n=1 Tax=Caenorhabditis japonica TaxID=281687 RepID=A0A8R1HYR9_CAEJA